MEGAEAFRAEGAPSDRPGRQRTGIGLIHGFTGSPISMRPLAEQLRLRGFRVDVPRLPGHGTDVRDMQRTRYADWRSEVVSTVDRLASESDRVLLVGLSLGATLVLDVASSGERQVAGAVSINAQMLDREGLAIKAAPLIERFVARAPAFLAGLRKDDIAKPGVSERAYDWVPTASGNSVLRELPRVRGQLAELRCPVLVAYSIQDHSMPPENSRAVLRLLTRAAKTELVLERSYHVATLDYDLELLVERITAFADGIAMNGAR